MTVGDAEDARVVIIIIMTVGDAECTMMVIIDDDDRDDDDDERRLFMFFIYDSKARLEMQRVRSHDYHDDCGGLFASQDFDVLLWMRGYGDDHHDDDELCTPGITSSYFDNRDCAPPASQVRFNGTVEM